jgi:chemotaxis protein CheX
MESVSAEEIYQVTRQVWVPMLSFDLKLNGSSPKGPSSEHSYACTISLNGDWKGGVVLLFQDKLAKAAAQHIFGIDDDEVAGEDIRDAVGELTNQVGGLVKSKLAPQSLLSLPTIAEGMNLMVDIPNCKQIGIAAMESQSAGLNISIWKYIPDS